MPYIVEPRTTYSGGGSLVRLFFLASRLSSFSHYASMHFSLFCAEAETPGSEHAAVPGDNGQNAAADDILVVEFIHIDFIKMVGLQLVAAIRIPDPGNTAPAGLVFQIDSRHF